MLELLHTNTDRNLNNNNETILGTHHGNPQETHQEIPLGISLGGVRDVEKCHGYTQQRQQDAQNGYHGNDDTVTSVYNGCHGNGNLATLSCDSCSNWSWSNDYDSFYCQGRISNMLSVSLKRYPNE